MESRRELHDFARQLERELAAAQQIASKYEDRYFATRGLLNVSTERAETLERWLAEANARIRRLEEEADAARSRVSAITPEVREDLGRRAVLIMQAKETRP
jgi:predicted  nucleic acid-binding Zn-ribbon protein